LSSNKLFVIIIYAATSLVTATRAGREFADGVNLAIGAIALERQRVMVLSFDSYYERDRHIDGLIGFDFFAAYVVGIDFQQKELTVWRPDAFAPPEPAIAVPLAFVGRVPVVGAELTLPGGELLRARLLVDTGASQAIMFRNPFSRAHRLFDRAGRVSTAPSLASGQQRLVDIELNAARVGELTFDHPPALAFVDPTGSAGSTDTDGLIGNALLSRYRVYVNYSNRLMFFAPLRAQSIGLR
jgi:hypothetical protein